MILLLLRSLLGLLVLAVAAAVSLAMVIVDLFLRHLMRTALYLLPAGNRAHRLFAAWVSHYCDHVCWKCGATPPSYDEIGPN